MNSIKNIAIPGFNKKQDIEIKSLNKDLTQNKSFYFYSPVFFQKVAYAVFFLLYKTFVSINIEGKENLSNLKGPIILAPNHTSELDVTIIPLTLSFFSDLYPIYFVSNAESRYNTFGWRNYIYGGKFFNLLGGYPVYLGQKNYELALQDHINLLKKGHTVCIFPEGKRTENGELSPGRGGLGFMAYATGATVVPIAINTFYSIKPTDFFFRRRKVTVTVLKPILSKDLFAVSNPTVVDFQNASQKVMNSIKNELFVLQ